MNTKDNKPDDAHEAERSIGYGTPPEETRFKKGISGNPKGRPKGSLNVATVFMKTLRERVGITENGQRKTITKLEAALKQLVNKSASGDIRALRQLIELARDAEAKQNMSGTQEPAISDLDQEVMDGILKRFQETREEEQVETEEKNDGNSSDNERG